MRQNKSRSRLTSPQINGGVDQVPETIVSYDFTGEGDDKIYFNIQVANNLVDSNVNAVFNQSISPALIDSPEDYYFAVLRYQIPTEIIPLMIGIPQPPPNINPNLTIWSFTLVSTIDNSTSQQFIIWVPTEVNAPVTSEFYYFLYQYTPFINMWNTALATAFAAITNPGGAVAPYFQLEVESGRISLVAQAAHYAEGVANQIQIFYNNPMSQFLDGLPTDFIGFGPLGKSERLLVVNNNNNWYTPPGPNVLAPPYVVTLLRMEQEYPCLSDWSPIQTIQIVSTLLPIRKESIQSLSKTDGVLGTAPIIQDFVPLLDAGETARTQINYVSGETGRQLINMYGRTPINQISAEAYWTDKYTGRQHRIFIPFSKVFSLKLGFFKKRTYTS